MQQLVVVGHTTGSAGEIAPAVLTLVDPAGASDAAPVVQDALDSFFNSQNLPELPTIV